MQVIVIMQLIRYEIYYPENNVELSFVENSQTLQYNNNHTYKEKKTF